MAKKDDPSEAGKYILEKYGISEDQYGLLASIDEFNQERRRDRKQLDREQRMRHAMGRRDPETRARLLDRIPPEDNPMKKKSFKKTKAKTNPTKRPKLPPTRTPRSRTDYGSSAKKAEAKRIGKRGKSKVRKGLTLGPNNVFVASIKSGDIYAGPLSAPDAEALLSRNKKAWIVDNKKHKRRVETGYFAREYGGEAKHFEKEYRPRRKDYILPENHEIVFEWARTAKEMPQWPPYPRRRNPGKVSKKTVYERDRFASSIEGERKLEKLLGKKLGESPAAKSIRLARDRMEKMATAQLRALIPKMEKARAILLKEMEAGRKSDREWFDSIPGQENSRKGMILEYKMQTAKEELESRSSKNPSRSRNPNDQTLSEVKEMILTSLMETAYSRADVYGLLPESVPIKTFGAAWSHLKSKGDIAEVSDGDYAITPKGVKTYMALHKRHIETLGNPSKKKASKKKTTLKTKAKKAGRKVKKAAKTDVGRAGIGGGIGALALGPIGAVIGAGYAISSSKKKKSKKNPGDVDRYTSTDLLIPFKMYIDNKDLTKKRRAYWKKWGVLDRIDELTARGIPVNISSKEIGVIDGSREDEYPGTYNVRISKGGGGYYKKGDTAFAVRADKIVANNMEYFHGIPDPAFIRGSRIALGDKYRPHGGNVELPNARHNPPKRVKKNPEPTCKLSTTMGNLLLDYHKAGEAVDHVAASSLRGERVELRYVKAARADLKKIQKIQPKESEEEQIGELVDALGRVIAKCEGAATPRSKPAPKSNPARAFSLETEVNRSRQKKAKGAAGKHSRASSAASDAARQSLRKRMAALNPGSYRSQVVDFSDDKLDAEHKAASSLITRAKRHPDTSQKMVDDLVKVRGYITAEKSARRKRKSGRRGSSGHVVPVSNPTTVGRSKGKFAKLFTPDKEEIRLLRKYKMMDKLEDVSASQIERIVTRLKRQEKEELKVEYPTVMDLAATYARARSRYQILVTSPGTSPGDIARAKKKFDEAEDALALYAEIRNMDQKLLKEIVWHTKKKEREAKSRAKGAKSNPDHGPVKHIVAGGMQTSRRGFKPFFHPKDADPESILKASLFYVANKGKVSLVKLERKFGYKFVWRVLLNEKYLKFDGAPAMSIEEIEKHFKIYPTNELLVITPKGKRIADRARVELSSLSREEQEWEEHVQRPRDNPLSHVTERTPEKKFRAAISRNIATEMKAGRPQKQAIAIALNQARSDAPKKATKIYGPKPNPEKADKGVTVIPMQLPAEAVNRMIKEAGRAIKAGKGDEEYGHWEKSLKEWGIPKKIAIDVADGKARIVGNLQDGYYHEYINPKKNPSSSKSKSKIKPDLYTESFKKFIKSLSGAGISTTVLGADKETAGFDVRTGKSIPDIIIFADASLYAGREVKNSIDFDEKILANSMDRVPEFESLWRVARSEGQGNSYSFIVSPRKKPKLFVANPSSRFSRRKAKGNPEPTLVTKGKIGIAKFKGQGKGLTEKDLAQLEEIKGNLEIHYELASLYTGAKAKNERARIKDSLRDVNELIRSARRRANPKGNPTSSWRIMGPSGMFWLEASRDSVKGLLKDWLKPFTSEEMDSSVEMRAGDIILMEFSSKGAIGMTVYLSLNRLDWGKRNSYVWRVLSDGYEDIKVMSEKKSRTRDEALRSLMSLRDGLPSAYTKGEGKYRLDDISSIAQELLRSSNPRKKPKEKTKAAKKNPKNNPSELEGPLRFASGRVVYYDPGEGKYYDRDTDLYLSESEVESMQSGSKGRAKANPKKKKAKRNPASRSLTPHEGVNKWKAFASPSWYLEDYSHKSDGKLDTLRFGPTRQNDSGYYVDVFLNDGYADVMDINAHLRVKKIERLEAENDRSFIARVLVKTIFLPPAKPYPWNIPNKANPKPPAKKKAKGKPISDKEFWKQIESLNWPKLRKICLSKGLSWDEQREALLKKKPMSYWEEIAAIAQGKADVVVTRLDLGVNDFAWDFSSDIVGHGKRTYDRMISDEAWAKKQLDSKKYGAENFFYIFPRDDREEKDSVSKEELSAAYKLLKKEDPLVTQDEFDMTEAYARMKESGGTLGEHMDVVQAERASKPRANPKAHESGGIYYSVRADYIKPITERRSTYLTDKGWTRAESSGAASPFYHHRIVPKGEWNFPGPMPVVEHAEGEQTERRDFADPKSAMKYARSYEGDKHPRIVKLFKIDLNKPSGKRARPMYIYVGYPKYQADYKFAYGKEVAPRTRYLSLKKKPAKKNPTANPQYNHTSLRKRRIAMLVMNIKGKHSHRVNVGSAYLLWMLNDARKPTSWAELEKQYHKIRKIDGSDMGWYSVVDASRFVDGFLDKATDSHGVEIVSLNWKGKAFVNDAYGAVAAVSGEKTKSPKKSSKEALLGEYMQRGLRGGGPRKETEEFVKGRQKDIFASMRKHAQSQVYDNPTGRKSTSNIKDGMAKVRTGTNFNGWKLVKKDPVTLKTKPHFSDEEHVLVVVDPISGEGDARIYAIYDERGNFSGERAIRYKSEWPKELNSATKWANSTLGLSSSVRANPKAKKGPKKNNPSELEGPLRFASGRVVYYDPGEGKYYDKDADLYLSESEVESMQGGPKGRAKAKAKKAAKKNPSRQSGGFYIVDTRVGKVAAGPYSVREADMTLEESAGYDHATHQVMDERHLADLAFDAKGNPTAKKKAKAKANPRAGSDLLRYSNRVRYEGSGPGPEGLGLKRNDLVEMEISRGWGTGSFKRFGRVTDVISVPNSSFGKTITGYEINQWDHGGYEGYRNPLSLVWERVGPWYGSGPGSYREIKWRLKVRDDLYKNRIKDIFEVNEVKRVGRVESDASGAPIQRTIALDPRHREYIVFTETYAKAKTQKKNPLGRGSGNSGPSTDLKDYRISAHNMSDRVISATFNKLKSSRDPVDRQKANILGAEMGVRDSVSRHRNPGKVVAGWTLEHPEEGEWGKNINGVSYGASWEVDNTSDNELVYHIGYWDNYPSLEAHVRGGLTVRTKTPLTPGRILLAAQKKIKGTKTKFPSSADVARNIRVKFGSLSPSPSKKWWSLGDLYQFNFWPRIPKNTFLAAIKPLFDDGEFELNSDKKRFRRTTRMKYQFNPGSKVSKEKAPSDSVRKKNGSGAPLDWEKAQGESRVRKDRDTRIQERLYGTFDGDSVVDLAKWTHSKRAKRIGIRTSKDRLKVINRESRQGNLRATPADFRKAKSIALKEVLEKEVIKSRPSFYGDLEGRIEHERIYINDRISKARLETEKETLRRSFKVRKKALLVTQRELLRAGDLGIKKNDLKRKVTADSGATTDSPATWSINVLKNLGLARYSDKKWRAVSPNPSAKKVAKKATRKNKPGWKILTDRCDKLWDDYDKKPTKKNLNLVLDHLAKMKASTKYETSKKVRDKRASCLRKANKEAKRLGMKL